MFMQVNGTYLVIIEMRIRLCAKSSLRLGRLVTGMVDNENNAFQKDFKRETMSCLTTICV